MRHKTLILTSLIAVIALLQLNACGIRPGSLEPPSEKGDQFPHQYPVR